MSDYAGSPWRSRFLRAPKLSLALAGGEDFVPLDELADLRLGLKSGADKFFFVRRGSADARNAEVDVVGLGGGWRGTLSRRDLRPAALNPHELFEKDRTRRLTIPRLTPSLYLMARDREPMGGLRDYVTAGEHEGINRTKLVVANAGPTRWFRQTRALVTAPWALPYNSGYDYGAWANPHGAILNGRFVGVTPRDPAHSLLLGAVLNSTFVMMTRLLEGTATGVEGAFDVGPPAARKMAVPDIRKFSSGGAASVAEAIESWRVADRMPSGPATDGHVDDNRHRLDLSILGALGLSKGEASVLIGNVYESYSRWRRAIEAVEGMMRLNRKEMARNLSGRSVKPTDMAAQRVWEEVSAEFTVIPRDLLSGDEQFESVALPRKLRVRPGQPGLIPGLLVHSDGSQTDLGSFERVRYADMLLSIGFEPPLVIPIDATRAGAIADVFERTRAELVNVASKRAALYVNSDDAVRAVVRAVERHWMRNCRLAGLEPRQRS